MNLLGAVHGVDDRGKLNQEGITNGFDNVAVMFRDSLLHELVMDLKQPQHAGFIVGQNVLLDGGATNTTL